jgi:hypothetical protein
MNKSIQIRFGLYALLLTGACLFGYLFRSSYNRFAELSAKAAERDPVENLQSTPKLRPVNPTTRMMVYGAFFVMTAIGFGLLVGHDFSHYLGERAVKVVFDDEGELAKTPEYELAEQQWADGNPLEAIQLMRNYLKEHPREQHVALRIAEIYEKDLKNYLAAALEYEEVLKQKLLPEQWGWTAIHLCNLYSSKLEQPEKALALLQRIDTEYGGTAAAGKARKHLAAFAPADESTAEAAPPPPAAPYRKRTGPASDEIKNFGDDI